MATARSAQPHLVGAVCGPSSRRRLGGLPAGPGRARQAFAVGPGPNGNPRKRARPSSRPADAEPHPHRDPRRARRAVGDGGRRKMRRAFSSDRRNLGRPQAARLHRDPAAGGRVGTQRHAVLAGAAWRHAQPQRSPNALADRERAVAAQSARRAGIRIAGVGRGPVPRAGHAARTLDRRA